MFNEILQLAEKRFSVGMNRANAHADFAFIESGIAIEEAEISYIESAITESEMVLVVEQATEGIVGKVRAAIKVIIAKITEFFKAIKEKIVSVFTSEKSKKDIDAIEKKVKLNPFARNKKVELPETDKKIGLIKKTQAKYAQLVAKIKSGKTVTKEEIEDVKEGFNKEYVKVGAAVSIVGAVAALGLIKKRMSTVKKDVDDIELTGMAILAEVDKQLSSMDDVDGVSETAYLLKSIAADVASSTKEGGSVTTGDLTKMVAEAKKALSFSKETPDEVESEKTSRRQENIKNDDLFDITDKSDLHVTSGETGFVGDIMAILEGAGEEESAFDLL